MNLLQLYYYTSVPLLTCNLLYYSLTAVSASIVSTQNVSKFIYEHPLSDTVIFKRTMDTMDLHNKLKITESLIFDVIKQYCETDEEFEMIKHDMLNRNNQNIDIDVTETTDKDIMLVDVSYKVRALEKMKNPVKISLLSLTDTVQSVSSAIEHIKNKISKHNASYFRSVSTINLQDDIEILKKQGELLENRLQMLLNLLKVYNIC